MLLTLMLVLALQAKADERIQKSDAICHYLYRGATIEQLRTLYQTNRCLPWQSYSTDERLLDAVILYREEIEKTWPGIKPSEIQSAIDAIEGK